MTGLYLLVQLHPFTRKKRKGKRGKRKGKKGEGRKKHILWTDLYLGSSRNTGSTTRRRRSPTGGAM
jgi:hypothetical protein